jgi:cytochrome c5
MLHGVVGAFVSIVAAVGSPDGKALYLEHCAACHGKDGGGDGPTAKDLRFKPRAFKEGRFAFGNTADVMAKTVTSGIPGEDQPRMPPFKTVMDAQEIEAVVEYVRSLMPKQQELGTEDMTMVVTNEAKVARGILAPLHQGEKPLPRGLVAGVPVAGVPGGFSFEYATDDFHLVAVRRGGFLTRSDWEGRGGRPLTPLGTLVWSAPSPQSWIPFAVADPPKGDERPAFALTTSRLLSTKTRRDTVEFESDLVDAKGVVRAHVVERPTNVAIAADGRVVSGVVQEFVFTATNGPVALLASLAASVDPKTSPQEREKQAESPPLPKDWYLLRESGGACTVVGVGAPPDAKVSHFCGESHDCVDVQLVVAQQPVVVLRATMAGDAVTSSMVRTIAKSLKFRRGE